MLDIFEKHKSKSLKGFFFFIPMVPTDDYLAALDRSTTDPRIVEGWDGKHVIGNAFAKPLALGGKCPTAWDVYLVYKPGVTWTDENAPPRPSFWMHQLSVGADPKLHLDPKRFERLVLLWSPGH